MLIVLDSSDILIYKKIGYIYSIKLLHSNIFLYLFYAIITVVFACGVGGEWELFM